MRFKRTWRYLTGAGVAVLVTSLVLLLMPAGVSINQSGFLSIGSHVVLAVNVPPDIEKTEQSRSPDEITYYFDSRTGVAWNNDPDLMLDGILTNYAYTSSDGDKEGLNGSTCPGTDLGTITKVEIRAYAYGDGNDRIDFSYTAGPEYQTTPGTGPPGTWGSYIDVTNDIIMSPWTWAKVQASGVVLVVEFDKVQSGGTMYAAKVEIRVTYWTPPVSDIDVGAHPVDRVGIWVSGDTLVDKTNPANASGTLTSVKVYAQVYITDLVVGTFYTTNGNTLKCRDSESIGAVEAGAERTFTELSITVQEGDYIGCYFTGGQIEHDSSGFGGLWYVTGEFIDPNDETEYTLAAGHAISLYGYGNLGAAADISNLPTSKAFSVVTTSATLWSNGSEPTWPLVDGDAYFTVTNNGATCSITIVATNFTGGVGWTLAGTPDTDTVTLVVFEEGDGSGDGLTLTTSPQAFIAGLAGSADKDWELKFLTATSHTDGAEKTSIITLAATLD